MDGGGHAYLKGFIRTVEHRGVTFYDIEPLLANDKASGQAARALANMVRKHKPTLLLGLELRGFALALLMAQHLGIAWKMVRKAGKTPGEVYTVTYDAEYGPPRVLELGKSALKSGDRVVIVDDVLATGGTAQAAEQLVALSGASVVGHCFLVQIIGLQKKPLGTPVATLLSLRVGENTQPTTTALVAATPLTVVERFPADNGTNIVIVCHPSMYHHAQTLVFLYPGRFTLLNIVWRKFVDGSPNITFCADITNRHVVFLGSLSDPDEILNQLMVASVLPGRCVRSLSVVYPYYGSGSADRSDDGGESRLATAETLAKLMSASMLLTKNGPANVCIYDMYRFQERFYFDDRVRVRMYSAIPTLLQHLDAQKDDLVIVFPDNGAAKKFGQSFEAFQHIVCNRVRTSDTCIVIIEDRVLRKRASRALIVDDSAHTGNTLYECMLALRKDGFEQVSAYVTHAVFENQCYLDFLPGGSKEGFYRVYVSDTIPEVTRQLPAPLFQVVSVLPDLARQLLVNADVVEPVCPDVWRSLVAGESKADRDAVQDALEMVIGSVGGDDSWSTESVRMTPADEDVPAQSAGRAEMESMCRARFEGVMSTVGPMETHTLVVAVVSGIGRDEEDAPPPSGDGWYDEAAVLVGVRCISAGDTAGPTRVVSTLVWSDRVYFPTRYYEQSKATQFQRTVGEFVAEDLGAVWPTLTKDDWHAAFGGGKSRRQLLADAIVEALLVLGRGE